MADFRFGNTGFCGLLPPWVLQVAARVGHRRVGPAIPYFRYAISYGFFHRYLKKTPKCSILRTASIIAVFFDECCEFMHHTSACLFRTWFLRTGNIQFVSLALSNSKYCHNYNNVTITKRASQESRDDRIQVTRQADDMCRRLT
jgi:hypothetical protein